MEKIFKEKDIIVDIENVIYEIMEVLGNKVILKLKINNSNWTEEEIGGEIFSTDINTLREYTQYHIIKKTLSDK